MLKTLLGIETSIDGVIASHTKGSKMLKTLLGIETTKN
jgi:hypothetical protein